jgi:uncharacterized membrane protein
MSAREFPLHCESVIWLDAAADAAFDYLDDFKKLSAHMETSSPMMAGSRMTIATDELGGRAVGSRVRMQGRMLGMSLSLEEVVTERNPPHSKAWRTLGARLLVIGQYRLGFRIEPGGARSRLRVFIDYQLPAEWPARWLGRLFGGLYARWCTARMAHDAERHFAAKIGGPT